MPKRKAEFPIIDDERYEIEAELAVHRLAQLEFRKKLRRAKPIVIGYYIGAFLLPGITLTNSLAKGAPTSVLSAGFEVGVSFACGGLVFLSGRLLQTAWVADLEFEAELAGRKARQAEKRLRPLLGVVAPR
jgi:hypothetical protein